MSRPYLTIIIPAYNEARRLPDSLSKISTYLRAQSYSTEILVVENGSTDETSEVVRDFARTLGPEDPFTLELLHSARQRGSGKNGDAGRRRRFSFHLRCRPVDAD